jgi:hypothetical protein
VFKSWIFKICASKFFFKIITENYVRSRFCWSNFHQNRTRIDFWITLWKIVVLYEIYSKKLQWPDTFGTSLYKSKIHYRHGMCFRMSYVFVSSILFWFPQCTHYFWRVFRFLFLERKQDSNLTSVENVQGCF